MKNITKKETRYYNDPNNYFKDLLKDIKFAKKKIYIETYRLGGEIAFELRAELLKCAKRGVKIKLLIDHWGSMVPDTFFKEIETLGAQVRFFRVFKITTNLISYNNRRDHRKIVLIDDDITYIGSSNITDNCKAWREFIIRIKRAKLNEKLEEVFLDNFKLHNFFLHSAKRHIKPIKYETLEIVRDVPSLRFQKIRNKHLHLIRGAKQEVLIETPYFVPDLKTLLTLMNAAKRGVDVKLILPKKSDMTLVDTFTQSLFGKLHKRGVKILFYNKKFSHSKISLIDNKTFSFGSSNFDYRSFRYQYEIAIFGKDEVLLNYVKTHLKESLKDAEEFNYETWRKRPLYKRLLEIILDPIKHFF